MVNLLGNLQQGPKCGMCNRIVIKIVPLYDDDQKHKKTMCCQKCKQKIRNGEEIVKYTRKEELILKEIKHE